MPNLPLTPHFKYYRGSKEKERQKAAEFNSMAQRVADYINTLIVNNSEEIQVYLFDTIASKLGLRTEDVRSAISDGGYNGRTFSVDDADRTALAIYKRDESNP